MGFKATRTYRLAFADPEYEGLEVVCRSMSVNDMLDMAALAQGVDETNLAASMAQVRRLFEMFASSLKSWNIEDDDDTPVPATYDGVMSQDLSVMLKVVMSYIEATASVPPPLAQESSGGARLAEGSIPMETLSVSRLS